MPPRYSTDGVKGQRAWLLHITQSEAKAKRATGMKDPGCQWALPLTNALDVVVAALYKSHVVRFVQQALFLVASVAALFFHVFWSAAEIFLSVNFVDSSKWVAGQAIPVRPPHFWGSFSQQVDPDAHVRAAPVHLSALVLLAIFFQPAGHAYPDCVQSAWAAQQAVALVSSVAALFFQASSAPLNLPAAHVMLDRPPHFAVSASQHVAPVAHVAAGPVHFVAGVAAAFFL